ncbi:MAG: NAD(+)/NADH kinase [Thermodesulfobacteriota bacterium]
MKKFGMVIKTSNPEAVSLGCEIAAWVAARGGEVCTVENVGAVITPSRSVSAEALADAIEVMIVLGGDGTMLSAARMIGGRRVPILGVNMGGLGFLTAITTKEVYQLLERILRDDYAVEERMRLSVNVTRGGTELAAHDVLNDVVIKGLNARLIRLETSINRDFVTTYRSDGLIVATPTGSTAYSLSAAGPILYPTIHSIIVVPVCPFNFTNRPVVIPDWMTVDVKVCPSPYRIALILDGQMDVEVECGDTIHIKRSDKSVYLIRYEGKSYFDILRERFMWEAKDS